MLGVLVYGVFPPVARQGVLKHRQHQRFNDRGKLEKAPDGCQRRFKRLFRLDGISLWNGRKRLVGLSGCLISGFWLYQAVADDADAFSLAFLLVCMVINASSNRNSFLSSAES